MSHAPIQLIITRVERPDGTEETQLTSNVTPGKGVWQLLTVMLLDALRLAIRQDLQEEQPPSDLVLPMGFLPPMGRG